MSTPLTWLYAPGDRPDAVEEAFASGADTVIVDLEDAVAPERKEAARAAAVELLATAREVPVSVRVNGLDSPHARADVLALAGLDGVWALRLPKVTGPGDVATVIGWMREAVPDAGRPLPKLHCMLESALGIERAFEIATADPLVAGISIGDGDLRADLGVSGDGGLAWARSRVVVAARAAGLPPPAQSVYRNVDDLHGLARSCALGRELGFYGRAAIHPRQLPVIVEAYRR